MQLYAFDQSKQVIFSKNAEKKCNYTCMECGGTLRLREGEKRQHHFYHLALSTSCRQHSKSDNHLQVQLYLQKILSHCDLEYRFSEVNRIADVAWHPQKIVFEVQCSPLCQEEMLQRSADYNKCGYQVIWILHDNRYNKWRQSALEKALDNYYFTNIDANGEGFIYDQWDYIEKGIRKAVLPPLPIDPSCPYPGGFQGDLASLNKDHPYLARIKARELELKKKKVYIRNYFNDWSNKIFSYLLKPYCD